MVYAISHNVGRPNESICFGINQRESNLLNVAKNWRMPFCPFKVECSKLELLL